MKKAPFIAMALAAGLAPGLLPAQAQSADVQSVTQLLQKSIPLHEKAEQGAGLASETLKKYSPGDFTMLTYRDKSGKAELHKGFADYFVVLGGAATLVSGGSVVNPKPSGPGEIRGDSVHGGTPVKLRKGDVVHIPANVPHQMLIPSGGSLTYFVIKVADQK